jgi:hypothetical protein
MSRGLLANLNITHLDPAMVDFGGNKRVHSIPCAVHSGFFFFFGCFGFFQFGGAHSVPASLSQGLFL